MNSINLNEQQLEMIEAMGGTGFSPAEIAEVVLVKEEDFIKIFNDQSSDVYKRYRKGFLEQSLKLRQRIFKDAGHGSSPAQTLAKKIMDDCNFKNHLE